MCERIDSRNSYPVEMKFRATIFQWLVQWRWATAALGLLILVLTVGCSGLPRVGADAQRSPGYIPELGFVNLEQARMLTEPVEVERDGVVLRVEHLAAGGGRYRDL